ncbi:MAG: hypothetical protein PHY48_15320 [Candidatus Cloacimonetes bacterium]|nr:hypothetical protein [Candidatus Cloacimonadota bacterium]
MFETLKLKARRAVQPKNEYEDNDIALWHKYKAGDDAAKWQLLDRFSGLISDHANKFSNVLPRVVVEAQLKQHALKAFDTYNPGKDTKLSTHIMYGFKKLSRENIKNQQAVRLPENIALKYKVFNDAKLYLTEVHGREPTSQEMSEYLSWGIDDVVMLTKRFHKELVESKQVYDPGVTDTDIAHNALLSTYYSATPHEQYFMEHVLGHEFMGKPEKSADQIRRDLKLNSYQYYKLKDSVAHKVNQASTVLEREM